MYYVVLVVNVGDSYYSISDLKLIGTLPPTDGVDEMAPISLF